MRYSEVRRAYRTPDTHPHVATISIDPADHRRISRMIAERPELRDLYTDTSTPDRWTMHVGCASKRVRDEFDDWINGAF
jgi:ribulose bisphosphate carboxylase small subunit